MQPNTLLRWHRERREPQKLDSFDLAQMWSQPAQGAPAECGPPVGAGCIIELTFAMGNVMERPAIENEKSNKAGEWWHGAISGGLIGVLVALFWEIVSVALYGEIVLVSGNCQDCWVFYCVLIFLSVGLGSIGGLIGQGRGAFYSIAGGVMTTALGIILGAVSLNYLLDLYMFAQY